MKIKNIDLALKPGWDKKAANIFATRKGTQNHLERMLHLSCR